MSIITLKFPADTKIAVIGSVTLSNEATGLKSKTPPQWYRDERGSIIATYSREPMFKDGWTYDELETCLKVMEASENCRLSRQKKDDVVEQAMMRFGAKKVNTGGF